MVRRTVYFCALILLMGSPLAAGTFSYSFVQQSGTTKPAGSTPATQTPPPVSGTVAFPGMRRPQTPAQSPTNPSQNPTPQPAAGDPQNPQQQLQRPTPAGRTPAGNPRRVPAAAKEGLAFSFTDTPIDTVIGAVMKELGYSYVIDPSVSGTVNLYTQNNIPRDRLFTVLEQLLKMNGQAIIRQEDLYVIVPMSQSPRVPGAILKSPGGSSGEGGNPEAGSQPTEPEPTSVTISGAAQIPPSSPLTAAIQAGVQPGVLVPAQSPESQLAGEEGVVTYIIPLYYIPSSEMVTMIKAFVSEGAQVVDFQSANLIIVTDFRANILQVLSLVELLDTQYFNINQIELVQIRYNKAEDVASDLGQVFAPGDRAGGVRIVAIERLNSLLVVTHSPAVFTEVKGWIDRLDAPASGSNLTTYVYEVENNTASNIAEILAQLYEDGAGLPSSSSQPDPANPDAPRQRDPDRTAGFISEPNLRDRGTQALGPRLSSRSESSGVRAVVSGAVKIIVNEFNNSLIIQGTQADYHFLLDTIKQLDVLPRQVLMEAKIYAVELRNDLSYGVSYFLQERGAEGSLTGPATVGRITSPSADSSGGALSAATRLFIGQGRQLDILVNALRTKTNVEVLESPTLLVVDGTEAQINVGAEVPVTTASFGDPLQGGNSNNFVNSIQFRPTGTTLLLLPRITASGIVNMDIAIEVSSATGTSLTPTINRNFVRTSLIARDRQQIAIAGIISDQFDVGTSRVPILGDIPVIGGLFGQTSKNRRRFELIFLITPYVIRNLPTAVELTIDFRRALRRTYDFINEKDAEEAATIEKHRQQEELLRQAEPPAGTTPPARPPL